MRPFRSIPDFIYMLLRYPLQTPIRAIALIIQSREDAKAIEGARRIAREKGIIVKDVEREVNRTFIGEQNLPKAIVASYSLRHPFPKKSEWSFLHHEYKKVAEYPGFHSPVIVSGELTSDLDRLFKRLSKDELWQSMFFEIECNKREVSIYWDEREGEEAAMKVIECLHEISRLPK